MVGTYVKGTVIFLVTRTLKDMQSEFFLLIISVLNVMEYLIKIIKGRYNIIVQICAGQHDIISIA